MAPLAFPLAASLPLLPIASALLLPPHPQRVHEPLAHHRMRSPLRVRAPLCRLRMQSLYANDGDDVDWDKEISALSKPQNKYYKAIKEMESPAMIREFAETAPSEVQTAVKVTISQLLGAMPPQVAEGAIQTQGRSLASLMFSMQMTGYMFRNAEYRRSLANSIGPSKKPSSLPPVTGEITVKVAEGLEAKVDAQAYMAELRAEVEGLREELALARQKQEGGDMALIKYMQSLDPKEGQELSSQVTPEVLEAMGQLVASILSDFNVTPDMVAKAPVEKVRELLLVQLVSGYKLRELEVREGLKSKFWDQ